MSNRGSRKQAFQELERFIARRAPRADAGLPAISLFSGGGISDLGYQYAGFDFAVHSELNPDRAKLCAENFPRSEIVTGDLREEWREVVERYEAVHDERPALLTVTPPCQGMSSSNPSRGKVSEPDGQGRNERNLLLLAAVPIIERLRPSCVLVENVPQILLRTIQLPCHEQPTGLVESFFAKLAGYVPFTGVVQMADYGVPQVRRRSVVVLLDGKLPTVPRLKSRRLLPWPKATHSDSPVDGERKWVTVENWFRTRAYRRLDARSAEAARDPKDPLHFVPCYPSGRYSWVSEIPPRSGRSAYENDECPHCGNGGVETGLVRCPHCHGVMTNRPHIVDASGNVRLISGFKSSYRRMYPNRPAPTVTTAGSHLGSDYKIHPWENRVLSVRECLELQCIPKSYRWDAAIDQGRFYLIREVVGEAIPPWFTYLHGRVLRQLLSEKVPARSLACAEAE